MSGIEKAISSFRGDFNCAQSVFSSYATQYGLDKDTALKLSRDLEVEWVVCKIHVVLCLGLLWLLD